MKCRSVTCGKRDPDGQHEIVLEPRTGCSGRPLSEDVAHTPGARTRTRAWAKMRKIHEIFRIEPNPQPPDWLDCGACVRDPTDEHLRTVIRLIGVPRAAAMIYETHPTTHVQPRARLGRASLAAAP